MLPAMDATEETMPDRQPWERRKGESRKAYDAFCCYRDLDATRSGAIVAKALGKSETLIERWSARWGWVERAHAWDDHAAAIASDRALDAALATKQAELEENERQKALRLREARSARTIGRAVMQRFLELVQDKELDKETMLRHKDVTIHLDERGNQTGRVEIERKGIVEMLKMALPAIVEGHKLERLELGEVTDRTEMQVGDAMLRRLAEVIRDCIPPDRWESVGTEIDAVLRGEYGNGKPE